MITSAYARTQSAHGARLDAELSAWAARPDPAWLDGTLHWFSNPAGREMSAPRGFIVAHLFDHQNHHRGQVHALHTAAGESTGEMDLP